MSILQDDRRGPAGRESSEDRWQQQQGAHGGQRRGRGEHYRTDRRVRQDRYVNGGGHDGYWQGSRAHMQRSPAGYQAPVRPPPPPPPENGRGPMLLASTGPEPMMNMYQQQQLLLRQQQQRMAGIPMDAYASNVVRQPMGISQEAPGYSHPGIHSHMEYQYQGPIMNRGYRGRGRGWQGEGSTHHVRQPVEQSFEGSHHGDHPLKPTKSTDGKDLSSEGQDTSRNLPRMEEDEKQKKLAAIRALREEQAAKNRELAEKRRKKIEEINAAEESRRKRAESIAAAKAAALRKRNEDLQYKRDVLLAQKEAELQMLRQKLAEKTRQRESSSDEIVANESQAKKQKMEGGSVVDGGHLEDDVKQDLKA